MNDIAEREDYEHDEQVAQMSPAEVILKHMFLDKVESWPCTVKFTELTLEGGTEYQTHFTLNEDTPFVGHVGTMYDTGNYFVDMRGGELTIRIGWNQIIAYVYLEARKEDTSDPSSDIIEE